MGNTVLVKPEAWQKIWARLIESNRVDLANRYHQVLRKALFESRSSIRPNMLKGIASDEVDALKNFISQISSSATEHGQQLYQIGLNEQAVLRLGQVTRQFILTHLEDGQMAPALEAIDTYQELVVRGYIQTQEKTILKEQELIRSAFQTAISRYTVEIKEIEALAQKATEANEFKTQFIARMGHELRTPLGAMMGMAEMLQEGVYGQLTSDQKDITQRIINNAIVLKQIFADLLDQSQIESGQLRLREAAFSPQVLTEEVHSNFLPLALQNGLTMQVKVDSNLPRMIIGDKTRIEQILSNLVVNAIKYTETGSITIQAYRDNATHWAIAVKDTGIGIAPEHLTYIFEPFRQTDESTSRKHGGVGLGLAIVQQLVSAMNGTIDVKSKFGQGSQFTVILPLQLTQ
jgi:signal transduction histidine kinase